MDRTEVRHDLFDSPWHVHYLTRPDIESNNTTAVERLDFYRLPAAGQQTVRVVVGTKLQNYS